MITFLKSFIIGICAILPGVSGSVIAVSLGIYDRILEILTDYKKIKKNKIFLLLFFVGLLCGILLTGNLVVYIFKYKTILYYILTGVIISEIPFIIKKIHNYSRNRIKIIPFLFSFLFSLLLDLLNGSNILSNYSCFKWFLGGILFSFGKVFPGISSSFFLLNLGLYDDIIILIVNPLLIFKNIYYYIPFIIGALFGLLIFIRILSYLINNKYEILYSCILGFIISSIVVLIPPFKFRMENIIGFILMIVFCIIFIYIKKKND